MRSMYKKDTTIEETCKITKNTESVLNTDNLLKKYNQLNKKRCMVTIHLTIMLCIFEPSKQQYVDHGLPVPKVSTYGILVKKHVSFLLLLPEQ
jgi:hypothetical protein